MHDDREPRGQSTDGIGLAIMGELATGGKVRDSHVVTLSSTSLDFHGDMSVDRWREIMRALKIWKTASTVWLADAITYGRRKFGQEEVEATLSQMEFDLVDAQRAVGIASLSREARPGLSSEQLWVMAKAKLTEAEQLKWADLALKNDLSANLLEKSIAAGKVITTEQSSRNSGRGSGLVTVQGIRQLFDTWHRKVSEIEPIAEWPEERQRDVFEELKGPARLCLQLARNLGLENEVAK
jgi:hypothetical protein